MTIALATTAVYLALAAAGHSPPVWMWAALFAINGATLMLRVARRLSR